MLSCDLCLAISTVKVQIIQMTIWSCHRQWCQYEFASGRAHITHEASEKFVCRAPPLSWLSTSRAYN